MAAIETTGANSSRALRYRIYVQLDPAARQRRGLSTINRFICAAIILSGLFAILETEEQLLSSWENTLLAVEWVFTCIFALEYVARIWTCVENPKYQRTRFPRLKYIFSPAALLDAVAIAPVFITVVGTEAYLLRLFRLLRILRMARLGRFSGAMQFIANAVISRRYELYISLGIALLLLVATSTLLYLVEGKQQPEAFGSIPRAIWWSAVTLTTVGYGDVYPVTVLGRVLASLTAVFGIGLIAMPTGILAAAFSDGLQRERSAEKPVDDTNLGT